MAMELGGEKSHPTWSRRASYAAIDGGAHCVEADGITRSAASNLSLDGAKRFATDLAAKRIFHIGNAMKAPNGPIAQLDRVTDFYSVGCRFESCWDRQPYQLDNVLFFSASAEHRALGCALPSKLALCGRSHKPN